MSEKDVAAQAAAQIVEQGQDRKGQEQSDRLDRLEIAVADIKDVLKQFVEKQTVKDWYSTDEVAKIVNRSEYTVRNWCLEGRINAEKKGSGRGRYQSWVISHAELQRIQKDGLLPVRKS